MNNPNSKYCSTCNKDKKVNNQVSNKKKKIRPEDLKISTEECKYNTVVAYQIKTSHINYKPRVIKVPSSKYCNINEAIRKLKERKGGYVIKLEPGIHIITRDVYENVDDLTIVGDNCPFAGMGYFSGMYNQDLLALQSLGYLGQGPFILLASGNKITVKGVKNPDFSFFNCERRAATFVMRNGSLVQTLITGADKNEIFFDKNLGSGPLNTGEGFFINPNVILKFQTNNQHMIPKNNLHLCGLILNAPFFSLGSLGGYLNMTHCVVTKESFLVIRGIYRLQGPNVFAGNVYLPPGTIGNSQNFFFVGHSAHLECDNTSNSSWSNGYFISSSTGSRVLNGSSVTLSKNQFINNCVGLYVSFGSTATIYGSVFIANKFGVIAYYNSTITNATNNTLRTLQPPPIFKNNVYALTAGNGSYIIIPKAAFIQNTNHAIIENKLFVLPTRDTGFHIGTSMVIETPNPFDITPADTKCTKGDVNHSNFVTSFQGVQGLHGVATKEVLENKVIPESLINQFLNAGSSSTESISCADANPNCVVGNPDSKLDNVKILSDTGEVVSFDRRGFVP